MNIYHVVSNDNYCKYYENCKAIDTSAINRDINKLSEKKKKLESLFEDVRVNQFADCPSRLTSLFVFSDIMKDEYEAEWANVFGNPQYILLTLEIEKGCVKWFDSSVYMINGINAQTATQYWKTSSLNFDEIKSDSVEGLFQGVAKIIKRESKFYTKGQGIVMMEEL
ncbi:hypothetical protein AB9N12_18105 [Bacteroides sp. AN502(2024)]|uniref:hypothetical protein n=1 Tax=Bacteroides sp. AN502(2024) TaxID=3160599 RepID=UPI003518CA2B